MTWWESQPKYKVDIGINEELFAGINVVDQFVIFGFTEDTSRHEQIINVLDKISPLRVGETIRLMRPRELKEFDKLADQYTLLMNLPGKPTVHINRLRPIGGN